MMVVITEAAGTIDEAPRRYIDIGRGRWTTRTSLRAGDGNRTRMASLEGWSSTIELHPRSTYITVRADSSRRARGDALSVVAQ